MMLSMLVVAILLKLSISHLLIHTDLIHAQIHNQETVDALA